MTRLEQEAQRRAEWIAGLHALADALAANETLPTPDSNFMLATPHWRSAEDGECQRFTTAEKFAILRRVADRFGAEVTEKASGEREVMLKFGPLRFEVYAKPTEAPQPAPSRVVSADEDAALIGGAR